MQASSEEDIEHLDPVQVHPMYEGDRNIDVSSNENAIHARVPKDHSMHFSCSC